MASQPKFSLVMVLTVLFFLKKIVSAASTCTLECPAAAFLLIKNMSMMWSARRKFRSDRNQAGVNDTKDVFRV